MEIDVLIKILKASIKKNGDKPLTLSYLLNILKLAEKKISYDGPSAGDGPDWND
jgi:hypothetical protein